MKSKDQLINEVMNNKKIFDDKVKFLGKDDKLYEWIKFMDMNQAILEAIQNFEE